MQEIPGLRGKCRASKWYKNRNMYSDIVWNDYCTSNEVMELTEIQLMKLNTFLLLWD